MRSSCSPPKEVAKFRSRLESCGSLSLDIFRASLTVCSQRQRPPSRCTEYHVPLSIAITLPGGITTRHLRHFQYKQKELDLEHCKTRTRFSLSGKRILRTRMLRGLGSGILFVILVISVTVILAHNIASEQPKVSKIPEQYFSDYDLFEVEHFNEIQFRPVRLSDFRFMLRHAKSPYDLLRIFYDNEVVPDHVIEEYLSVKSLRVADKGLRIAETSKVIREVDKDIHMQDEIPFDFEGLDRVYEHIEQFEDSPLSECKYPQPEVVYVRNLHAKSRMYMPDCTVIHRCRNVSGCCGNASRVCSHKTIEIVEKSFFVLEMIDSESQLVQPDRQMIEHLSFINHTECECKEIKSLPGCHARCPSPFIQVHMGWRCKCECQDDNRYCANIRAGINSLSEHELRCIKEKKCISPKCDKGQFDIKSGYCGDRLGRRRLNELRRARLARRRKSKKKKPHK